MAERITLEEIGEQLSHIVHAIGELPTKDDVAELHDTVQEVERQVAEVNGRAISIESELRTLRTDLRGMREQVDNIEGYRREIDHALERIARIEKHLGIKHDLGA